MTIILFETNKRLDLIGFARYRCVIVNEMFSGLSVSIYIYIFCDEYIVFVHSM